MNSFLKRFGFSFLSFFYCLVVTIRKTLYRFGLFSSFRPKAYTISVGNIVAGGAGKTPFTIFLAEMLAGCAVIVRPYKAEHERSMAPLQVTSDMPASLIGDEAFLIAKRVLHCVVWVGNKARSAKEADTHAPKYIVVDDGFQHFALQRDLDIVVVDSKNPFGTCRLLREWPSSLHRADIIVVNSKFSPIEEVSSALRTYSHAPIVHVGYTHAGFYDLHDALQHVPRGTKCALLSAIAEPSSFKEVVLHEGLEVVDCLFLEDHAQLDPERLSAFFAAAQKRGATCLICTEKDRVKLDRVSFPLYWLKIGLKVYSGLEVLLERISSSMIMQSK